LAKYHPEVQASANYIKLVARGSTDYLGQIYTGENYEESYVIFDTTSDWSIIMDSNADGM